MSPLLHNPIADMMGPAFLIFYLGMALTGAIWLKVFYKLADSTRELKPPSIPPEIDPLELGYLRGGEKEVLKIVLFDLVQRGFIIFSAEKVYRSAIPPQAGNMTDLEQRVYDWLDKPANPSQLLGSPSLLNFAEGVCASYRAKLREEKLILPKAVASRMWFFFIATLITVESLGVYKLIVAISKGRTNVAFLIVLLVLIPIFYLLGMRPKKISARGTSFLLKLRSVIDSNYSSLQSDDARLLRAGVYGLAALEGTRYAAFAQAARSSGPPGNTGSCGGGSSCSSSSSSCGGGGGCGGGCGGCGG